MKNQPALEQLKQALNADDAAQCRQLLRQFPELRAQINEPVFGFDAPAVLNARSRAMLDALLEAGADLQAKSRWWAGGFGALHLIPRELADYAIQRGAPVDAHAAARLGLLDALRELVAADPTVVRAPGGDGQTPLHFAHSVAIAEFLLDHGADIDARDIDHESTPAQYMVRDRPEVARFLVRRGCRTDLLMAVALGETELVRQHLMVDPACIRMRVSPEFFPMRHPHAGGTIYQWTLGWHVSAHDIAREFGRADILSLLLKHSPPDVRLLAALWAGDEAGVKAELSQNPKLVAQLSPADQRHVALAARNNNTKAVQAMLAAGFPVDALGQHRATPLHWAAFHGNAAMAREILEQQPPLELPDADFRSTPLGWAIHGSEHGWYCRTGDYVGVVQALLDAGAKIPDRRDGSEAVRALLQAAGIRNQ